MRRRRAADDDEDVLIVGETPAPGRQAAASGGAVAPRAAPAPSGGGGAVDALLVAEEKARRKNTILRIKIKGSRAFNPDDKAGSHFRFGASLMRRLGALHAPDFLPVQAEGQLLRCSGAKPALAFVEYVFVPRLVEAFETKRAEYDRRFGGRTGHVECLLFHGA